MQNVVIYSRGTEKLQWLLSHKSYRDDSELLSKPAEYYRDVVASTVMENS